MAPPPSVDGIGIFPVNVCEIIDKGKRKKNNTKKNEDAL
jgi:hypothetical protein